MAQDVRVAVPAVPDYPNVLENPRRVEEGLFFDWPAYVVEFQTADPPEYVNAFYKDRLSQMKWRAPFVETEDVLMMNNWEACAIYNLRVDTTIIERMRIEVVLRVSPSLWVDR
ncbi:MAG: hypothetical protein M3R24_39715 [Chloroflexota bacterium]|nr:hypothetical protein [Chloroflexota bacterium]